jgi:FtsP/CotA-like multicopper oxidase with cupredoxin domain
MDHGMAHGGAGAAAPQPAAGDAVDHAAMGHGAEAAPPAPAGEAIDHAAMGHGAEQAAPAPRMDLNDVEFDAYLANDRTLADPQVVQVERGGRVRLRIINGAAATNFFLDLGALEGTLIAVDGRTIVPVVGRRFPLAIAQRLDIRLALPAAGAFPVLAVREGDTAQTGIILATAGAAIARIGERAAAAAGVVDLALERTLRATDAPAVRPADRRLVADLTGSMMDYSWGINGARFGEHEPLKVRRGERVEIVMRNVTEMSHPMHLHGHHFQVVAIDEEPLAGAMRDTVLVPVRGSVTIAFDADNPGRWAFHCHNLYHMNAGMMTAVEYEG